ncbi:MAG: hypothetical protein CMH22_05500 [Methylophaga sp.]|nr:hypothetical protein [Methylophaga sp.]
MIESSGNPNAKSSTSSATGLYQFTESTWKGLVNQLGLNYSLEDRTDPTKSRKVVEEFTKRNRDYLKNSVGIDPNSTELYLSHFLGMGGGSSLMKKLLENPNATIDTVASPNQIQANKSIFLDKNGNPKNVKDIYNWAAKKFGEKKFADVYKDGQVYDIDENNNVVSVNPSTATEAQKKTSDAVRKSMLSPKSERIINEVKFQQAFYKNYSTIDNVNSQVQKQQEQEEKTTNKTQQKEETETTSQQPQFNPFSQQQTEQQKQYVAPQQEIDYTLLAPEENEFMSQFLTQFQKGGAYEMPKEAVYKDTGLPYNYDFLGESNTPQQQENIVSESTYVKNPKNFLVSEKQEDKDITKIIEGVKNRKVNKNKNVKNTSEGTINKRLEEGLLLKSGTKGDNVKTMQSTLVALGFLDKADGVFGKNTKKAVEDFQKANGLKVDGIAGKNTIKTINSLNSRKENTYNNTVIPQKYAESTGVAFPKIIDERLGEDRRGIENIPQPERTWLDSTKELVPLSVRQFIYDTFRGEDTITESDLSEDEYSKLIEGVYDSLKQGKNKVDYDTWRNVGSGGTDTRDDGMNLYNPASSLQKTLGQAAIRVEDNGDIYVIDTYNFNDAGDKKNRYINSHTDKDGLLKLDEAKGISNKMYRIARNFKTLTGRSEGGSPSRIYVGNIKDYEASLEKSKNLKI